MNTDSIVFFNGEYMPLADAKVPLLSHALHYGSGVFEGTRFYPTGRGPAIFRLAEHTERLFASANDLRLNIPFSPAEVNRATIEVVRKNGLQSGYIRPLAFFGDGKMGLRPEGARPQLAIAAWPWGKYLPEGAISVKLVETIRIHPKSLPCQAKVTGHYVNSIRAVHEAVDAGADEALMLDFEGNLAEGPGENLFLVKNGELHTPQFGSILRGITRETILTLARERGLKVHERTIPPAEMWEADEAFFTGTAAEVTPIGTVDGRPIGSGQEGPVTAQLRQAYADAVHGRGDHPEWITLVEGES